MKIRRLRFLKNWPLRTTLLVFLMTSILLTTAAVASTILMANSQLEQAALSSARQYARDELSAMQDSLDNMRSALYILANKAEIKTYIRGDSAYKFLSADMVVSTLNDIMRYIPQMTNVCIATDKGQITESQLGRGLSIGNYLARRDAVRSLKEKTFSGFVCLPLKPAEESDYALALAVPISGADGFCVSFSSVTDLLSGLRFAQYPFALKSNDDIIASQGLGDMTVKQFLAAEGTKAQMDGVQYYLQKIELPALGWQIILAYPQTDYVRSAASFFGMGGIYLAIFVLSECMLALLIYASILHPIGNIHAQTMAVRVENGHIINPVKGKNELSSLAQGINDMVERTNQLGHEMSQAKLSLMQAEVTQLRARNMFLQAQINPHFLYNMLECICGMSSEENAPRTREMAMLLAKLYRYCVDKNTGTLEEELECVRTYAQIIGLRYDEAYEIETSVPEDLLALYVPRMILEPVVENAIQHGFVRGRKEKGHIMIGASFEDALLTIRIIDNGCGMENERIENLNEKMTQPEDLESQHTSIGFFNVNSRIRLRFGPDSGLKLTNNPSGGLCVTIAIRYQ
jgi:sensor histidine kinase YesM